MRKRFLVTGSTGKIGSYIDEKLSEDGMKSIAFNRNEKLSHLDFRSFDFVIHAAAKAHIGKCEEDKKYGNKGDAWLSNVVYTKKLVNYCKKHDKHIIFLSTECIFDGKKQDGYIETDKPNPLSWYGQTKLEAEKIVLEYAKGTILRGTMAYGGNPAHFDIVKALADKLILGHSVKTVVDQNISFTYIEDIYNSIVSIADKGLVGIYHISGPSVVTVHDVGKIIANKLEVNINLVQKSSLKEYFGIKNSKLRPVNSILLSDKLISQTGVKLTPVEKGVEKSLKSWGYL